MVVTVGEGRLMQATLPDGQVIANAGTGGQFSCSDVHCFDVLGSTSEWLRLHYKNFQPLLALGQAQLCVTDWQQAGVGRRGNAWQTLPGNITVSMLSRLAKPPHELLGLSLVTGIAVAQVLEEMLQLQPMLKWPNDVILNDKKLGGLLTEIMPPDLSAAEHSPDAYAVKSASRSRSDVVTGIGVNVIRDNSVAALGIGATSLGEAGIELTSTQRDQLVGAIADRILVTHGKFIAHGWSFFAQEWSSRDWLCDKPVNVLRESSTERTVARGVNEQGALLIESADKLIPLYGGNVSIRTTV